MGVETGFGCCGLLVNSSRNTSTIVSIDTGES